MNATIHKSMLKKSLPELKKMAQEVVNRYVRIRDSDSNGNGRCISCNKVIKFGTQEFHGGHFYSVGKYPKLRFNLDNIHGQCLKCNYFESANLLEYRKNLITKIGLDRFYKLEQDALLSIKSTDKIDKIECILIIQEYRELCKNELKAKR